MQFETISKDEVIQLTSSMVYSQSFVNTIQEFLDIGDKSVSLHCVLDSSIATERQRIYKMVSVYPSFKALRFQLKEIDKKTHLFVYIL